MLIVYIYLHTDPGEVIPIDALLQTWPTLKHSKFIIGKTYPIGPSHDLITCNEINYAGTQVTQWDFQNKGKSCRTGTSSFVLEVPLCSLRLVTFQAFSLKYSCRTSFLQYYQVLSVIPKHLLSIAKQPDTLNKSFFTSKDNIFPLNDSVQINFGTARSRDFYKLLVSKTHTHHQTGPNFGVKTFL